MSVITGRCQHGVLIVAVMESAANEEELREVASTYDIERADEARFEGECIPCSERYLRNCQILGIEP